MPYDDTTDMVDWYRSPPMPIWPAPWRPPAQTVDRTWLLAKVPMEITVALVFTMAGAEPQHLQPQITFTVGFAPGSVRVAFSTTISFRTTFSVSGPYLMSGRYRY